MNNIAVWNTAFLGDAILTLPLLQSLRNAWPEARIDYYVRGGLSGLFTSSPAVDNVYEFKKQKEERSLKALWDFGAEVRSRGYNLWLAPHPSLRSAWMARQSGASLRIGYTHPWYNRLFYTKTVERHFPELHEIERVLQLAGPLKLPELSRWPEIVLSEELHRKRAAFFSSLEAADGASRPVLGLHPGSVWGTKRWPSGYFARIGQIALQRGARVLVFGGPGEEDTAAEVLLGISEHVSREAQERVYNMAGKLKLPELAACIAGLSCYVGNDSGPMHLAWCQCVPTVALFGATVPGLGFTPLGDGAAVMEVESLDCRPCGAHGPRVCPKKHFRCMNELVPDMVWPEVEKRLFAR